MSAVQSVRRRLHILTLGELFERDRFYRRVLRGELGRFRGCELKRLQNSRGALFAVARDGGVAKDDLACASGKARGARSSLNSRASARTSCACAREPASATH